MTKLKSLCFAVVFAACGVQLGEDTGPSAVVKMDELNDDNGFSANGFSANGMSANGFSANGFSANGFSANGMSANGMSANGRNASFDSWFNANVAQNSQWLKYLVKCGEPAGNSVTYVSTTGTTYVFAGSLGAVPNWRFGNPTVGDQELMTSCLMAHVNSLGQSVTVSMRAANIPTGAAEMSAYPQREGAFFGNIFAATKTAYVCDQNIAKPSAGICRLYPNYTGCYTTAQTLSSAPYGFVSGAGRTCASVGGCGFTYLGGCNAVCTGDTGSNSYASCTGGDGKAYTKSIATFQPKFTDAQTCEYFNNACLI